MNESGNSGIYGMDAIEDFFNKGRREGENEVVEKLPAIEDFFNPKKAESIPTEIRMTSFETGTPDEDDIFCDLSTISQMTAKLISGDSEIIED